jgi:hypothetical protein
MLFSLFFCLTFSSHFFILLFFLGIFCQIELFFSISSSNLRLVGNWGSRFFPVGLHRTYDRNHEFERLTQMISIFFSFFTLILFYNFIL